VKKVCKINRQYRYGIALLLGLFFCNTLVIHAQYFNPKGVLAIDLSIPTNERNLALRNTMEGLVHTGIAYQYNVWKGMTIGGGVNYSFFKADHFALQSSMGRGGMHMPAGHLKLGYEKFTTERFAMYGGLRGGYSAIVVVNDSCTAMMDQPFQTYAPFLELQFEITMLTESNGQDGFNIGLGYSFYFETYNRDFLCREDLPTILDEHTQGIIRFLSIGFGYKYFFQK